MKEPNFLDTLERTAAACAWLIDAAQHSVDHHGWDPVILRYLDTLGQRAHDTLTAHGGMGAVALMKRSATAVEKLARSAAGRVPRRLHAAGPTARHDKQIGGGVLMRRPKVRRAAR